MGMLMGNKQGMRNASQPSEDGKYQIYTVRGSYAYLSSDYGATWGAITSPVNTRSFWRYASISSTGQYMLLVAQTDSDVYKSSNYGVTWTKVDTGNWNVSQIIGDGATQMILSYSMKISTDYGATWNNSSLIPSGFRVYYSMSASYSGQYQILCSNTGSQETYYTDDYGVTWSAITEVTGLVDYNSDISSTGQYMVIGTNGGLFFSDDYGVTFSSIRTGNYSGVSISSTGQYIFIAYRTGRSYYSDDYGVTFTEVISIDNDNCHRTGMSGDGKYLLKGGYVDPVRKSNDFGASFSSITGDIYSIGVAINKMNLTI